MKYVEEIIIHHINKDINGIILQHVNNKNFFEDIDILKIVTDIDSKHNNICKKRKKITNCPHKERLYYAKVKNFLFKNMCENCYHLKGRTKSPWNCKHNYKHHYALGLCQNCYQIQYINVMI